MRPVGPWLADPKKGTILVSSGLAGRLTGRQAGRQAACVCAHALQPPLAAAGACELRHLGPGGRVRLPSPTRLPTCM